MWKPDLASVSDPEKLRVLLIGLYTRLQPSGALLAKPTAETPRDRDQLLVCLTKFYGAAFVMGARNLPRPTSAMVSSPSSMLPFLVKLYEATA